MWPMTDKKPSQRSNRGNRRTAAKARSTTKTRSKESKAEKRAAVQYAAYKCFSEHGYHRTTVDAICEEAGISKGSFYWYFDSKQAAFVAILDAWADDVEREMTAQFAPLTGRSRSRYRVFGNALLREAKRSGAIMPLWLQFISEAQRDPKVRTELVRFHARIRRLSADIAHRLLPGPITEQEADSIGTTVFASFLGLVSLALADPDFDLTGAVQNTLVMMIKGLERFGEPPPSFIGPLGSNPAG